MAYRPTVTVQSQICGALTVSSMISHYLSGEYKKQFCQAWAQFCCKIWGGQFSVKSMNHRADAEGKFYKYRFPILFIEVF